MTAPHAPQVHPLPPNGLQPPTWNGWVDECACYRAAIDRLAATTPPPVRVIRLRSPAAWDFVALAQSYGQTTVGAVTLAKSPSDARWLACYAARFARRAMGVE